MLDQVTSWLLDPAGLTPHGFCLLWDPGLIWIYAVSDAGIGLAYFSIPLVIAIVARRRGDLVFRPVLWLFAAFILLCGSTHFLDIATLWIPLYGLEAVVKALTAVVSIGTAFVLWRILPQVLALPTQAQLQSASDALRQSEERLHQSQKMEAVGQLTGGVAHDINNMLQGIAGSLDLLERRIRQGRLGDAERYIAGARRAVESAAGLTHRMLAFARRQTLMPRPIEPDKLIEGIQDLIRRSVTPVLKLQLQLRDGVWRAICDPNQLESALLNLAINARDAMPDGGTITVTTADRRMTAVDFGATEDAVPGDYVEITVSDTGTGMTQDVVARVFEPFFTTKPIGQGTGLGLSQVYGFVRQSDGFIRIESTPGAGTKVAMYLPRHIEEDAQLLDTGSAHPSGPLQEERSIGTVLVVDDEETVRFMVSEALRDLGLTVLEADDGPSGLRIVQSRAQIDLLVTDVGLPGFNGRQLAEATRQIRPAVPVLLITGYAGKILDDAVLSSGMEVIPKPFSIDRLTDRVTALIAARANRT